jgi:hypothetical protein
MHARSEDEDDDLKGLTKPKELGALRLLPRASKRPGAVYLVKEAVVEIGTDTSI